MGLTMGMQATGQTPWYERAWFATSVTYGFVLLVAVKAVHSIFFKANDFDVHLAWGRMALDGALLSEPAHYPPGRFLIDEGLALLPRLVARTISFVAALASLFVTWGIWRRLAEAVKPAPAGIDFAAAALAFILLAPWVVRDFDECGLQVLLLFVLSMAAWSLYRGARLQAGAWLGLAITYKLIPLLFIPLLIWKRRFVEAATAICFVAAFNLLLPALVWGPTVAGEVLMRHVRLMVTSATGDPAENGIERPSHRSQSLRLAIARYLQTYPPGHPLFIDRDYDDDGCPPRPAAKDDPSWCQRHPLFVQFLDLSPVAAGRIVTAVLGLIAIGLAWRMRRRWWLADDRGDADDRSSLAPEWAVACAFVVLLSPLAWLQHLTLALPCAYLVIRDVLLREARQRPRWALLGFVFVCTWILQRDPLTKQLALVAMSYHLDVMAVLLLVMATLAIDGAIRQRATDRFGVSPGLRTAR